MESERSHLSVVMPSITYDYLSCAVNRTSHVADWIELDEHDALVFGVHKAFVMWLDPACHQKDTHMLPRVHMWPVQCDDVVHVLKVWNAGALRVLVGTCGGHVEVWRWTAPEWVCEASVKAHDAVVSAIGVPRDLHTRQHCAHEFVTGGSDARLHVWRWDGDLHLVQTIDLGGAYPLDVAFVRLPNTDTMLMAAALTDKRLSLYVRNHGGMYVRQLRLAGHEDWIRALDFTVAWPDVWLASAAQDQHVRLWKMHATDAAQAPHVQTTDTFEAMARELMPDDQGIRTKTEYLDVGDGRWGVSLDALLLGHDAWVTGVRWCPTMNEGQPLAALLTSSVDHSVILWTPDATMAWPTLKDAAASQSLWLSAHRLGDVGSMSGGFFGVHWRPRAELGVMAHDRQGAIHIWNRHEGSHKWTPQATISGHVGAVRDAAWERHGDCFLTVGQDRTTRLHGTSLDDGAERAWHELARPQTHGYEMQAVAWLDRLSFVSAADEKVLRVFTAPKAFVESAQACHMWQTPTSSRHVLALEIRERAQWFMGKQLSGAVKTCMERVGNDAFNVVVWYNDMSMSDAQDLLQRLYTEAWACAVRTDRLLADITVYLVPAPSSTQRGQALFAQWAKGVQFSSLYTLPGDFAVQEQALECTGCTPMVLEMEAAAVSHSLPGPGHSVHGDRVVLGGTFDHLHIGHKLLLTMAALSASKGVLVGVTSTELLTKKKHREYVESIDVRSASVRHVLRDISALLGKDLDVCVVPISDPCGPAATDPNFDVLIVTDETVRGGEVIADERVKNQVKPLDVYVVSLVNDHDAAVDEGKVGSTGIRAWLADKHVAPGAERAGVVANDADRLPSAHVPPLGLSNRATEAGDAPQFTLPPNPEQLQSLTLWPEMEKLYGHGYELLSVATDPTTHMVASTCKASSPTHAVVRLFDAQQRFEPAKEALEGHTLSVTRVAFSTCGTYLLTVSRDRSWRMFRRTAHGYEPWMGERAHARIVWDGAWAPHTHIYATASRDKSVKIWQLAGDNTQRPYQLVGVLSMPDAAMSVAWASASALAVGLESGDVRLYTCIDGAWQLHACLARHHSGPVNRLAFRPHGRWANAYDRIPHQLVSAGEDGCTRLVSWYIS